MADALENYEEVRQNMFTTKMPYGGFTYKNYLTWDEENRWELIDGIPHMMGGASVWHQGMISSLLKQIGIYLEGKPCKVFTAPFDVRLFYEEDESDDTVVQPDISIVCDRAKRGPQGCLGAPDLVVEILSPSNTAIEMEQRFQMYKEAGVREYWIVDSKNNRLKVYRFLESSIITDIYKSADHVSVSIFPELKIALGQVFEE